ncbi:hypothetical protein TNCV_3032841 [Trichonephila clavipes]|nr:hypothetical protein TNCV_3032841 [Trichonephila clavipes]
METVLGYRVHRKKVRGQGHPKGLMGRDRHLSVITRLNRGASAYELYAANGTRDSRFIVLRRLIERGLFVRRPVVCVPLSSVNIKVPLRFCRDHCVWKNGSPFSSLMSCSSSALPVILVLFSYCTEQRTP